MKLSFVIRHSSFVIPLVLAALNAFSATPIKDLQVTGTSALTSGTFTTAAGTTFNFSAGTVTFADAQIPWAKVSKTSSSLADLATRSASDINSGSLAAARLASTITAAGPIGDATHVPVITYNASGQLTAVTTATTSGGGGASAFTGLSDVPASYSGAGLKLVRVNSGGTALEFATPSANDLTAGTLPDARFPATLPAVSGVNVTALNGSNIASGTVPIARLDTGTAANKVVLGGAITAAGPIGDSTHTPVITYNAAGQLTAVTTAAISGGGGASVFTGLSDVPASYSGAGLKLVRVNTGATALEFVSPSSFSWSSAPAGNASSGTAGDLAYDSIFLYIAYATNQWGRIALSKTFGNPVTLTRVSDGDGNGLFYYLGTTLGTTSWTNPHTANSVTIGAFNSSNATDLGTGTLAGVVDRSNTDDNRTNNAANSYWRVALPSGQTLACTYYTFRARPSGSGASSNVASWKLQGSADASTWTDLDTRSSVTYTTDNEWKSYAVTGASAYRYHRILHQGNVTGANSFFFLSELELYGVYSY